MEKQVLVNESSLVNIADALRDKLGETYVEYETEIQYIPITKISQTSNAIGFNEFNGSYPSSYTNYDTVTIEGASKLKIKIAYQTEGIQYDWVQVVPGATTSTPNTSDYPKRGGTTLTQEELEFLNTNTVTFYFRADSSNGNYLGYYAEVIGYDENDNVIQKAEEVLTPVEIERVFKPSEMSQAIGSINSGGWELPRNNEGISTGESAKLVGVLDETTKCVTFDLSSKIQPGDFNWLFGTYAGNTSSGSTKNLVLIHLLTTQITADNREFPIDRFGIHYVSGSKTGYVSNPNAMFPTALYIDAYYNPVTCKLRIDYRNQIGTSTLSSRVDSSGQMFYRLRTGE